MSQQIVERFIGALGRLEEARDLEPMAALYAAEAEIGNIVSPDKFKGPEGAREFWHKYRDTFGEMRSTFRNRIGTDNRAALEWTTEGTTVGGAPVGYEGVSILEFEGEHITRFCAYFSAEALGRQITEGAAEKAGGNLKAEGQAAS